MTELRALTAADFFAAKLAYETDPSDVVAARASGQKLLVLAFRNQASWDHGHLPGAVHVPGSEIEARPAELPPLPAGTSRSRSGALRWSSDAGGRRPGGGLPPHCST